jgi:hypothetical protein
MSAEVIVRFQGEPPGEMDEMPFWKKRRQATGGAPLSESGGLAGGGGQVIVEIGRKELIEEGFEFCGPELSAAFAAAGLNVRLDDQRDPPPDFEVDPDGMIRWLWVDDHCIIEEYGTDVEIRLGDGQAMVMGALEWDLIVALRERYNDPSDPHRNWHYGAIDEGYLLILCRADQLPAVERSPEYAGFGTYDRTGATEVGRTL